MEIYTVEKEIGKKVYNSEAAYKASNWDEYRRHVEQTCEFLFEDRPGYTGEDPEDLMKTYGYTKQFAEDVCEEIKRMLIENSEA